MSIATLGADRMTAEVTAPQGARAVEAFTGTMRVQVACYLIEKGESTPFAIAEAIGSDVRSVDYALRALNSLGYLVPRTKTTRIPSDAAYSIDLARMRADLLDHLGWCEQSALTALDR